MMGLSGTVSLPSRMEIFAPCAGGVIFDAAAVDINRFSALVDVAGTDPQNAAGNRPPDAAGTGPRGAEW